MHEWEGGREVSVKGVAALPGGRRDSACCCGRSSIRQAVYTINAEH